MLFPFDIDTQKENDTEFQNNQDSVLIHYITDSFQDRYKNAIQDENGNPLHITPVLPPQIHISSIEKKLIDTLKTAIKQGCTEESLDALTQSLAIEEYKKRGSSFYRKKVAEILLESPFPHLALSYCEEWDSSWRMDIVRYYFNTQSHNIKAREKEIDLYNLKNLLSENEYQELLHIIESHKLTDFKTVLEHSTDNSPLEFLKDPAYNDILTNKKQLLQAFEEMIEDEEILPFQSSREKEELMLHMGRNFFFENNKKQPSINDLKDAVLSYFETRHQYKKKPLFQNRDIIFFAGNEKYKNEFRFAAPQTQNALSRQGKSYTLLRFEDTKTTQNLDSIQQSIINAPPGTTFLFAGHGSRNESAIILGDGLCLTIEFLTHTFLKRFENLDTADELEDNPDILLFLNCFNHSTYRKLIAELQKKSQSPLPLPIGIIPSEYGQSYENTLDENENHFFKDILHFDTPDHVPTFQDIFENEFNTDIPGNPSVYIPKNGTVMQIAVNLEESPNFES